MAVVNKGVLDVSLAANGVSALSSQVGDLLSGMFGNDTEAGRISGTIFGTSIKSIGNTAANNILKGEAIQYGMGNNLASSLAGAGMGLAGNYIGLGITSMGDNSMLSRGVGAGLSTAIGSIGGQAVSNVIKGKQAFGGISDSINAIKTFNKAKKAVDFAKDSPEALEAAKLSKLGTANLVGLGGQIVGAGLQAAFGKSKEYGGRYGNITQGMDTAYDIIQGAAGFVPGVGTLVSGAMALNKGLSNVFGSTSGMTKTDAILGSAFMPAPVKWLNMAGASTTGTFNNLSWLNTQKADSFMQNAFGNLNDKFNKAREEAGKTYGTFSQGAKRSALANIDFANTAWGKIMDMADLNEYLNIRSLDMSSINNLRYAQMLTGGFSPISRGKLGMKIFNNATNHNIGMRLLSGAALIDNKQMILCSVQD